MPRKKNLNGLANNVTLSFLSTMNYECRGFTHCGYGVDWVYAGMITTDSKQVKFDILKRELAPYEMEIPQLTNYLYKLEAIILAKLTQNQLNINELKSAILTCSMSESNSKYIIARTEIEFLDGWIIPNSEYQGSVSTEVDFFPVSLAKKLSRKLKYFRKNNPHQ